VSSRQLNLRRVVVVAGMLFALRASHTASSRTASSSVARNARARPDASSFPSSRRFGFTFYG
jgi:hypothetical protein